MNDMGNDRFDRYARGVHARALDQVPAGTVHALAARGARGRSRWVAGPQRAKSGGWLLAGGFAAVSALAVTLYLPGALKGPGNGPADSSPTSTLATDGAPFDATRSSGARAAALPPVGAGLWEDGLAALDEDPDLYLWLGSQDSLILAME